MAKLKLVIQTPSIELPVTSKDGAGKKQTIIVGFNRYVTEKGLEKAKIYDSLTADKEEDIFLNEELKDFVKNEVLYLKKASVTIMDEDTGKTRVKHISDTRKVDPEPSLWANSEECLQLLLGAYLEWSSWFLPFLTSVRIALVDLNFEEEERKNS